MCVVRIHSGDAPELLKGACSCECSKSFSSSSFPYLCLFLFTLVICQGWNLRERNTKNRAVCSQILTFSSVFLFLFFSHTDYPVTLNVPLNHPLKWRGWTRCSWRQFPILTLTCCTMTKILPVWFSVAYTQWPFWILGVVRLMPTRQQLVCNGAGYLRMSVFYQPPTQSLHTHPHMLLPRTPNTQENHLAWLHKFVSIHFFFSCISSVFLFTLLLSPWAIHYSFQATGPSETTTDMWRRVAPSNVLQISPGWSRSSCQGIGS